MSVKIHDGMKATSVDVFEVSRRIRGVVETLFYEKFAEMYERVLERSYDPISWAEFDVVNQDKGDMVGDPLRLSFDLYQRMKKSHDSWERSFPLFSVLYEICLIENAVSGEPPLVMVFGDMADDYRIALLDSGVVVDFGYWNNTDPDEDVSDEQWEQRKAQWGVLLGDKAPIEVGLSITQPPRLSVVSEITERLQNDAELLELYRSRGRSYRSRIRN